MSLLVRNTLFLFVWIFKIKISYFWYDTLDFFYSFKILKMCFSYIWFSFVADEKSSTITLFDNNNLFFFPLRSSSYNVISLQCEQVRITWHVCYWDSFGFLNEKNWFFLQPSISPIVSFRWLKYVRFFSFLFYVS